MQTDSIGTPVQRGDIVVDCYSGQAGIFVDMKPKTYQWIRLAQGKPSSLASTLKFYPRWTIVSQMKMGSRDYVFIKINESQLQRVEEVHNLDSLRKFLNDNPEYWNKNPSRKTT